MTSFRKTALCLLALLTMFVPTLAAQAKPNRTPQEIDADHKAHKGDFDYLLGDWEFTFDNKEYGKGQGIWSAVRLESGGILDEFRITDSQGETLFMSTTIRAYNAVAGRWE